RSSPHRSGRGRLVLKALRHTKSWRPPLRRRYKRALRLANTSSPVLPPAGIDGGRSLAMSRTSQRPDVIRAGARSAVLKWIPTVTQRTQYDMASTTVALVIGTVHRRRRHHEREH